MSRPLPEDREKALEAIAAGWARTPTTAHPLCECLVEQTVYDENDQRKTVRLPTRESTKTCPIHGGTT